MSAPVASGWGWRRLRGDLIEVLPAWAAARVLVLAGFVTAMVLADSLLGGERPIQLQEGLITWDGTFYRDIAEVGYADTAGEPERFFPLYPLLGRILAVPFGGAATVPLVVISNVAALAVGVLVRRLVLFEAQQAGAGSVSAGEGLARRSVWLMALVPPAFVLVFAYAEALMLAAAVGAFLALRQRAWWWAAALAAAAAATRPHGLLLVAPAAIEAARQIRAAGPRELVGRAAAVLGAPVGAGLYLAWVGWRLGDWTAPFGVQGEFRGEFVDPISRLARGVGDLFGAEALGDGLHLPFAVAYIVLAILTFRFWPASYGAFAALVLVVSVSADNLNSLERYGLNAFPLVLTLAVVARVPWVERAILAGCAGGLVALTTLALLGAYVP